jgi:hypothetical protein
MKYMLLLYADESGFGRVSQDEMMKIMGAYRAYTEALQKAGVHMDSSRLRPASDATRVNIANGKTNVLDGPYAETKEQLGGYFLIDVPDLDSAISWAAKCPGASHGTVEVRPLWA